MILEKKYWDKLSDIEKIHLNVFLYGEKQVVDTLGAITIIFGIFSIYFALVNVMEGLFLFGFFYAILLIVMGIKINSIKKNIYDHYFETNFKKEFIKKERELK